MWKWQRKKFNWVRTWTQNLSASALTIWTTYPLQGAAGVTILYVQGSLLPPPLSVWCWQPIVVHLAAADQGSHKVAAAFLNLPCQGMKSWPGTFEQFWKVTKDSWPARDTSGSSTLTLETASPRGPVCFPSLKDSSHESRPSAVLFLPRNSSWLIHHSVE